MNLIEEIKRKVSEEKKTIVLPETEDIRVLDASSKVMQGGFANILLIGNEEKINILAKDNDIDITGIDIINPERYEYTEELVQEFYELRKNKGIDLDKARGIITSDNMYFACMLVKRGYADGVVSGAAHSTADTLRPALQIIKAAPNTSVVSSFFLMEVPNCDLGSDGAFVFSDCGMIQNPTSEELAEIGASSASTFELLIGKKANVAFLSHSTYGSSKCADVDKVQKAVSIAKSKYPGVNLDGELQLDAAIVKEIGESKAPGSSVAGKANVLIFPDLDAGNIGYKLVERLAKAKAYGPITQGIAKPVNDLSRGCSVGDIVGVVAITALQAMVK